MLKNQLFKTHYELYSNRHDKAKIISFIDGKAEEVLHRLIMFKQKVSDRRVAIINKSDEINKEIRVSNFSKISTFSAIFIDFYKFKDVNQYF